MSTTTQGVDARTYLKGLLAALTDMTTKDIKAIPDDKWNCGNGGCSKSACDATVDAIGILAWTAEAMRGNSTIGDEESLAQQLKSECSTREGAIAKLGSASGAFMAALSDASDETLNSMVTPPWRMDMPLFAVAQIAVSHVWYHDGQLNYIQMLLGDEKVHWMDT
jgi:hypothetical protein